MPESKRCKPLSASSCGLRRRLAAPFYLPEPPARAQRSRLQKSLSHPEGLTSLCEPIARELQNAIEQLENKDGDAITARVRSAIEGEPEKSA